MASKKARKPNRAANKVRRKTHLKNQPPQQNNTDTSASTCSSSTTTFSPQDTNESLPSPSPSVLTSLGGGCCCTPKAQKSRIPEMLTCPPAPKKQRVPENIVLRRRQIVFFAPPEIELFFVKAYDSMNNF